MQNVPWLEIFKLTYVKPQQLPGLLSKYNVTPDALKKISQPSLSDNEAYGRKVLFKSDDIEVMLADWSVQAEASPHNHGQAQGLIWFVSGPFSEKHFKFSDEQLMASGHEQFFLEDSVVKIDSSDIHSCRSLEKGLSLHIYSPPITKMKVWDTKGRRTLTVADHCGAWVPEDKSLIVDTKPWSIHVNA